MSCCGQKRALQRAESERARAENFPRLIPPALETFPRNEKEKIILWYLGKGSLSLLGHHTGIVYYFEEEGNGTMVDENDLTALLLTQLFERRTIRLKPEAGVPSIPADYTQSHSAVE